MGIFLYKWLPLPLCSGGRLGFFLDSEELFTYQNSPLNVMGVARFLPVQHLVLTLRLVFSFSRATFV